jgi:cytochrome b pre-mRNA-processing protein 3
MLDRLFGKPREKTAAITLYQAIVTAARQPFLYREHGVPDTVEGRLELVMLHTSLVIDVLRRDEEDAGAMAVSQALFDAMFDDFDAAMREMGVGDSGIGKKIRFMAEGFYGRSQSYLTSLAQADNAALERVLARNLLGVESDESRAGPLAAYVRGVKTALEAHGSAALTAGECPEFPSP